jgi:seryl-tRNA synthetase
LFLFFAFQETTMINPQLFAKDLAAIEAGMRRRGAAFDPGQAQALDQNRRQAACVFEAAQTDRNRLAQDAARAKRAGADPGATHQEGLRAKERAEAAKAQLDHANAAWRAFAMALPNLPAPDVPDGQSADDNVTRRQEGAPSAFDFQPKTHDELGALHHGLDFEAGAALAGARFVVAAGPIARLHRALIQFMLDEHVDEHGYLEIQTPYLVKAQALEGTGQLPKFEEDLFKLERDGLYLIPTAEVPVTNLLARMNPKEAQLPLAFACHTPCFRREAGSAGRDVKGLIRQHQFEKVELVRACAPQHAAAELELLLGHAEAILAKLRLPYRVVDLCAGDLGFASERTVDLEVWLPGQNAWREISSVSRFGQFQARRMGAKFQGADGKRHHLATLNGSGLAAGRALVAVMENFQRADGSIDVPDALRPYMKGLERIKPPLA